MELKGKLKRKYEPRDVPVIVTQKRKDWYIYIQLELSDCDIELLETEHTCTYHGQTLNYHVLQLADDATWRYRNWYENDIDQILETLQQAGALP